MKAQYYKRVGNTDLHVVEQDDAYNGVLLHKISGNEQLMLENFGSDIFSHLGRE